MRTYENLWRTCEKPEKPELKNLSWKTCEKTCEILENSQAFSHVNSQDYHRLFKGPHPVVSRSIQIIK
jgi:hypothetical protein